jgi:polysaccharide export outer membrane protein
MNKYLSFCFKSISLIYLGLFLAGCSSTRNIAYFHEGNRVDSANLVKLVGFTEPTIQPDDILAVSIFTIDPTTGAQVNQVASQAVQSSNNSSGQSTAINGFLVDKNGEIELSIIGKLKLVGLTTFQARELIRTKASTDFKNPSVQVRFANFKVTVMGEVTHPAMYTLPNEKVTVLDALSLAGDLTLYGKRENVLVIREKDGKKEFGRLNLSSRDIFNNPYYYLRQNDIVYIEPDKSKSAALNAPNRANLGLILSAISVLALAFTRIF